MFTGVDLLHRFILHIVLGETFRVVYMESHGAPRLSTKATLVIRWQGCHLSVLHVRFSWV